MIIAPRDLLVFHVSTGGDAGDDYSVTARISGANETEAPRVNPALPQSPVCIEPIVGFGTSD